MDGMNVVWIPVLFLAYLEFSWHEPEFRQGQVLLVHHGYLNLRRRRHDGGRWQNMWGEREGEGNLGSSKQTEHRPFR